MTPSGLLLPTETYLWNSSTICYTISGNFNITVYPVGLVEYFDSRTYWETFDSGICDIFLRITNVLAFPQKRKDFVTVFFFLTVGTISNNTEFMWIAVKNL